MALGNANSKAQSRGKNKPVIVKRRKEVVAGKALFTGTILNLPVDVNKPLNACGLGTPDTIVFHDGGGDNFGGVVIGTKVYTRRRVNDKFALATGAYKAIDDRGSNVSISIVNGGITALNRC
jgi:hypothetical protein|tara:strand:- start:1255 stop:1620 length:366 start_codon:yes stop_codon:yes gene_type:complete